jgi:hypothetical protein
MESGVLVVTSAGVSHRLVRQVAAGNPLSDTTLSGNGSTSSDDAATTSASVPVASPIDTTFLARKFPQTLGLSNGLSIRFPAGWKRQNMGEFIGLIPSDELIPLSMYMVLSVPFSSKVSIAGPEAAAKLVQVLGNLMPGMTREGNVEMLGENGTEGVRMRFTTPKMAGIATKIHVYAKNQGDLLILLAGMGSESSLTGRDAIVREMLQTISGGQAATESDGAANEVSRLVAAATSDRVPRATTVAPAQSAASTGARDPALLGVWRSTESFASSGTTLAIETVYRFNEDGTFTLGSQSAGGSATVGISSNFKISSTGTWSAANGVLKTVNQDGETGEVKYLFHEGQLVFKRGNGKYRFWGR